MRAFLFLLLTATLLFASCSEQLTPNGYKFIKHTNASGPKAQIGEYAYVHVYVFQNDSLVNSTRELGKTIPITVPDFSTMKEEEKGPGKSNPIADVVAMMAVGDSVSVLIPMDEKMKQAPQLQGVKKLSYSIVLTEIKNQEQYQEALVAERKSIDDNIASQKAKEPEIAALVTGIANQYAKGELKDKLKTTETGLKYMIVEEGTGKQAQKGAPVQVQYYGILSNGEMFDNSFQRGRPFNFQLGQGQVIAGWDMGIALLKEGDKAVLFIPPDMGYGAAGTGKIPGNSELIFYVELEKAGK